jgi:hypothetical protein
MAEPARHPVARNGSLLGAYHLEAIRLGLSLGELRPGDHIWAEGHGRWMTLEELGRLNPRLLQAPEPEVAKGPGFLRRALGGVGTLLTWVVVIGVGLFIGMLVQGGGRNPNRQGANDPLRDPYAGGRDPDFDDRDGLA